MTGNFDTADRAVVLNRPHTKKQQQGLLFDGPAWVFSFRRSVDLAKGSTTTTSSSSEKIYFHF